MASSTTFAIHPPIGGISNATGYQTQPPYTAIQSRNFWPLNVQDGRQISATRPPQEILTFPDYPINMFAQLNVPQPTLFGAANGTLYKKNLTTGTSTAIASGVGVSTGRPVFSSPFFRQLLIANTNTPLVYDYDLNTLVELVPTVGFVPTGCPLTMNFQGACWLGGDPIQPHVFSCHRYADIHDWDFSADDENAAYISTGEDRGLITEPLTAMIGLTTDQAILGCEEELWVMSGHPRRGGRFDRISNQTGILGQNAWCNTPKGFFFLSHDGMMGMARNDYANLNVIPVSKAKVPDSLLNIAFDAAQPTVDMAYCSRWDCIYLTVRDSVNPQSWVYFLSTGAFYEQPLAEYPLSMFAFEPGVTADASGVLFGGASLRRFNRTASEAITSSQIIGPVKIAPTTMESAIIPRASILFSGGTTDTTASVELYTGPTANVAVNRALTRIGGYRYKTTVDRVLKNNRNVYPDIRGTAAVLRIDQTASTGRVVFEDFTGELVRGGPNTDKGHTPPVVTPPSLPILPIAQN